MKRITIPFFVTILCAISGGAKGQEVATVGFYNLENLHDTIPSLFYDDLKYTPDGEHQWGSVRYGAKLENVGRVVDMMDLDVLGVCEIENEAAVRDLVMALETDYNYVTRTSSDSRGMDLALLYKGDRFVVESVKLLPIGATREVLYVRGELLGRRVDIFVCHLPSMLNSAEYRQRAMRGVYDQVERLHREEMDAFPIIIGDFNAPPSDRGMKRVFGSGSERISHKQIVFSPFEKSAKLGYGTYSYNNRWQMLDNVLLSTRFLGGGGIEYVSCEVVIREFMLAESVGGGYQPHRTITKGKYTAGYSDHLPVYVTLRIDRKR